MGMLDVICGGLNCYYVIVGLVVLAFTCRYWRYRPPKFPPGPLGLPFFGSALSLTDRAEVTLMKMSWKFGPVMGLKLLKNYTVVLSDYNSIQEALVKRSHVFSGRPKSIMFEAFTGGHGIIATDGPGWWENRKFAEKILRKLGVGRKALEQKIAEESVYMCEALKETKGKPFNIQNIITHTLTNIICVITFGRRFPYDDTKFITSATVITDWFSKHSNLMMMMMLAPYLRFIPPFSKAVKSLVNAREEVYKQLSPMIEEHVENCDNYDIRDFMDAYIQRMGTEGGEAKKYISKEELLGVSRDLFVAGSDTTTSALRWALLYLINYQEVQKKIQKEIDQVIGADAAAKFSHLDLMPYTKAFMFEMLRLRTPGPLALAHRVTEDVKMMDYLIPKDTQIIPNLWALHHDPKVWDEPESFRPERFIDAQGKFKTPKNFIPFSLGGRRCLGENLAKMEYFLFVVAILQRFHLRLPTDTSKPISEECERSGQFLIPPTYKMRVTQRFSRQQSIKEYEDTLWGQS